jgi:hypothetical protein
MASAMVASPTQACQCSMGNWLVMMVALLAARSSMIVSYRQICMKSISVFVNFVIEFNPMRSKADGTDEEGREHEQPWREPGTTWAALQALA